MLHKPFLCCSKYLLFLVTNQIKKSSPRLVPKRRKRFIQEQMRWYPLPAKTKWQHFHSNRLFHNAAASLPLQFPIYKVVKYMIIADSGVAIKGPAWSVHINQGMRIRLCIYERATNCPSLVTPSTRDQNSSWRQLRGQHFGKLKKKKLKKK